MRSSLLRIMAVSVFIILLSVTAGSSFARDHAEPEGLILRQDGEVIVTVWEGAVTGEIEVHHGETTSDIVVSFLDAEGHEFTPEVAEGFSLYAELADSTALSYAQTGDWAYTLTGVLEGITGMYVGIFHHDHLDWLSPEIEIHVEEDHAEPEGLILRKDGEVIVTVWEGAVTGEIEVHHGETTSDIVVSFLDAEGHEFTPEVAEGFSLYAELADSTALSYAQTGDWAYTLTGVLEGHTGMYVGIFHHDHLDWLSPEIEIHVHEEHAEAEGLVLRRNGIEVVRVFEGVVSGEIFVGEGMTTDPFDVVFLDHHGHEFQPEVEEGFALWAELADSSTVSYAQTGDWSFTLTGLAEDVNELKLGILHGDHTDYETPGITVNVLSPADLEAASEGLVLALLNPAPNPVITTTTLRFTLPETSPVKIGVFDASGRLVERVELGMRPAGEHAVTWNSEGVTAGVYYVRMAAAGHDLKTRLVVAGR